MNKIFMGFRVVIFVVTVIIVASQASAQTNPTAFNLSGGNFSFTTQTSTNTTYPNNMQGWTTGTNNVSVLPTTGPGGDQALIANGTATTSGLSNLGGNGFNFISTGSSPNQQVGEICVSINTMARSGLLVSWLAADNSASTAFRSMNLDLQFRVGISGPFTTISGTNYTSSGPSQAASQNFTNIVLPLSCENQPVVQLRWVYWEGTGGGGRDPIRLDDISVTSSSMVSAPIATAATGAAQTQFTASWNTVAGASNGYLLDVSTSPTFGNTGVILTEGFESVTFPPSGWITTGWTRSTGVGDFNSGLAGAIAAANTGTLVSQSIQNPSSLTFYLGRSNNATAKTLTIEVSTTSPTIGFSTVATFDHTNVPSSSYNQYTVDLSAYSANPVVYIRFNKNSVTTSPWRLDDIIVNGSASFLPGYNAKPIAGQSTAASIVSGLISNTTYYYRLRAVDANGSSLNSNVISVTTLPDPPVVTSATIAAPLNLPFSYFLIATNTPTSYSSTGTLPTGLSFNNATGEISGTATQTGIFTINVAATNGGGTSISSTITITVADQSTADFRTKANGNFSDASIWEFDSNGSYVQATLPPAATNNADILSGHTVTLDNNRSLNAGKTISVSGALDFGVNRLSGSGALSVNSGGTVKIGSTNSGGGFTDNITLTGAVNLNSGSKVEYNANANQIINRGFTYRGLVIGGSGIKTAAAGGTLIVSQGVEVNSPSTLALSGLVNENLDLAGTLTVSFNATFDNNGEGQIINGGGGGVVINGKFITRDVQGFTGSNTSIPGINPTLNAGCTIEYALSGNQTVTDRNDYKNISITGSGVKSTTTLITPIAGTVTVSNASTLDVSFHGFGDAAAPNATSLRLIGTARFINGGGGTKPDMRGSYNLDPTSTIEFTGTSAIDIKLTPSYGNIEISGSNVSLSGATSVVNVQALFKVNSGGLFNVQNTNGLSNGTTGAVNGTVDLSDGSTIKYNGAGSQTIASNSFSYFNLTIDGTGDKTSTSGPIALRGNFLKSNTSVFKHNLSEVQFIGTAAQTYSSTSNITPSFYKVFITNAAGVTINDSMNVENKLALFGSGKIVLNTGNVVLRSTGPSATAYLDKIPNVANNISYAGNGRFVVERYISAQRKWNFLGINTTENVLSEQTIQSSWMENQLPGTSGIYGRGLWITNEAAGPSLGFDALSITANMKWWNGSSYTNVTNPTSFQIRSKPAYMTFVRGDRYSTNIGAGASVTNATILRTVGKVNSGDQSLFVDAFNEFVAFANPYPSAIDLSIANYTSPIDSSVIIKIWDPNLTGSNGYGNFQTLTRDPNATDFKITPGGGSYTQGNGDPMNIIESGQGFFVQPSTSPFTITITENTKSVSLNNVFRIDGQSEELTGNLYLKTSGPYTLMDGVRSVFKAGYNTSADRSDAKKFPGTNENVSIQKGTTFLSVEFRDVPTNNDTIHINMANLRAADYQWKFNLDNMDAPARTAYLLDQLTGTHTALNLNGENLYDFNVTAATPASYAADRFKIVFQQSIVLPVAFTNISAQRLADKSIQVKWTSENELNIDHYEIQRSSNGISFLSIADENALNNAGGSAAYTYPDLQPGTGVNYYRIKSAAQNGETKYSSVVKVLPLNEAATIAVNPNPVKDKTIRLQMTDQEAGTYNLQLINNAGQSIYRSALTITAGSFSKDIALPKDIAAGNYKLIVVNAVGLKQVINVVVE